MKKRLAIRRLRSTGLALASVAASFVLAHATMGRLAEWAERDRGEYLWWREEMMQLFTPTNYVDRGAGRIIVTGPSEIREAILPEVLGARLGRPVYQNAISLGTLDAVAMQLSYIERFYGPSAMPDAFIIGVTPRFVSNVPTMTEAPFRDYVAHFSPWAYIDARALAFIDKDPLRSIVARARLLAHQPRRYKGALIALRRAIDGHDDLRLHPSKFHHRGVMPKAGYFKVVEEEGPIPWSLDEDEADIRRGFAFIRDICDRHDVQLFLVAMPEGTWSRSDLAYPPGYYEKFLRLIRSASGVQPLNLRALLLDDEFHDWAHPTRRGAEKVTDRVYQHIIESPSFEGR